MKKAFFHGLLSGALAGTVAYLYGYAYSTAMMVDYSKVIMLPAVLGSCIFGCVIASLAHGVLFRKWGAKVDFPFNLLFVGLSLVTFMGPLTATLPLDVAFPELFAGATIPMHLFPVLFWLASKPLFVARS